MLDEEMGTGIPVIPASTNKNGSLSARSSAASVTQMKNLSGHVKNKITEFGEGIVDGDISVSPYRKSGKTACDYCEYQMICGFDVKLNGCRYRNLEALSAEQVWERIGKEAE